MTDPERLRKEWETQPADLAGWSMRATQMLNELEAHLKEDAERETRVQELETAHGPCRCGHDICGHNSAPFGCNECSCSEPRAALQGGQ